MNPSDFSHAVSLDSSGQFFMAVQRPCKVMGCDRPVVGNSITGTGLVCRIHNLEEWTDSLTRNKDPYYRDLGRRLRGDAKEER